MKRYIAILPAVVLFAAACSFNNPFLDDDPKTENPPPTYGVTVSLSGAATGESVTADVTEAAEGATVTLTAALGSGRQVVLNGAGITITPSTIITDGGTATFTMPAQDVVVSAVFSYSAGYVLTYTANTVSFNMHYVPPGGTFTMGEHRELTTQEVTLTKGFWMAETEVTQGLWEDVWEGWPNTAPSSANGLGDNYPAYNVNWYNTIAFCNLLTLADDNIADTEQVYYSNEGLTTAYTKANASGSATVYIDWNRKGFRLPTEAEWEYAARYIDGTIWNKGDHVSGDTEYACYDPGSGPVSGSPLATNDRISEYVWWSDNNGESGTPNYGTKNVGQKTANALGLCDMSGNVFEWCYDYYNASYDEEPKTDPTGPLTGNARSYRCGYWNSQGNNIRCTNRFGLVPGAYSINYGFRLCRTAD